MMWKELHDDIVKFKYIIEEAENGFYLRVQPSDSDDMVYVFEGAEEGFINLVKELSNQIIKPYDKFGTDNINISFDGKGHKVEDSGVQEQ